MSLKADKDGFLVGESIAGGEDPAAKWLADIKGDTTAMLALMKAGARAARPVAVPAGRSSTVASRANAAAMPAAARAAAVPAPRSTLARDPATGRYVAMQRPGADKAREQRAAQAAAVNANALAALARTSETARRDDKAAARAARQRRGSDGRFGSDGAGGFRASLGPMRGALAGSQQVDPLLGAAGEIGAMASTAKAVVTPLGRGMRAAGGGAGPGGWLRKVWQELRLTRRDDAQQSRVQVRKLADIEKASKGGQGGGGVLGMLGMLLPAISSLLAPLRALVAPLGAILAPLSRLAGGAAGGLAAAAGSAAGRAGSAAKGLLKRVPLLGALVEGVSGAIEDARIANDTTLTDAEKRLQRGQNAGGTGGAIAGALGGAAIGQALIPIPLVGAGIGAVAGGLAGSSAGKRLGGWVSQLFESGKGGAGTISSGKGDFGGKSYGTHQLASNTGTLQKFLASSPYGAQFAGMTPGSPEFDAKWKQLAATDKGFAGAQSDFMRRTHFDPQMARLKKGGIDLSGRGAAVQEAVFSTSTQFGANTGVIQKALAGKNVAGMSDAQITSAIQDYKIANNERLFRSSDAATRVGTLRRAKAEKEVYMGLATTGGAVGLPAQPGMPPVPSAPTVPAVPQMPSTAGAGPQRLSSAPAPAPAAPPAVITQDVPDRTIAHIVTGGIGAGGGYAHR